MKKYFAALSATALISVAPFAMASSTDLTVTGIITPSACTPSFTDGGEIDFGKIPVKDLNETTFTALPFKTKQLNVTCDAPVTFALKVVDDTAGSAADARYFGLGMTHDSEKIGHLVPWIKNVVADAVPSKSIRSNDQGTTWENAPFIAHNQYLSVSTTADTTPLAAQVVSMDVEVRSWIARADGLTLTRDVNIDGKVVFEMVY